MTDAVKALIDMIRADRRTTVLSVLCLALYGAGESLRTYGVEPWASILIGLGGTLAGCALLFTKFVKPQPPAPVVALPLPPTPPGAA